MRIAVVFLVVSSVCQLNRLSVPEATYHKQMKDCLRGITDSQRRLDANQLRRNDSAVLDGYDAILLQSVTCSEWAGEPLSDDAKAVIEKSGKLHTDMIQYMRYSKQNKD